MEGKIINEENHRKGKKVLIIIGIILAAIAVGLIIGGAILLSNGINLENSVNMDSENWMEIQTQASGQTAGGIFMLVFGVFLIFGSIMTFVFAHRREIASYELSTVAPVLKETTDFVADDLVPNVNKTVGGFVEAISGGIAGGIAKGKAAGTKDKATDKTTKCPKCGAENNSTSKFCGNCGEKLAKARHCTQCGQKLESNQKFCPNCGTKAE